jgi:hypothetical protein
MLPDPKKAHEEAHRYIATEGREGLPPTMPVPLAGAFCGMGSTKAYEEAHRYIDTGGREGLPAVAFGRTIRVPTVKLLALLGLDASANGDGDDHERDEEPTAAQPSAASS